MTERTERPGIIQTELRSPLLESDHIAHINVSRKLGYSWVSPGLALAGRNPARNPAPKVLLSRYPSGASRTSDGHVFAGLFRWRARIVSYLPRMESSPKGDNLHLPAIYRYPLYRRLGKSDNFACGLPPLLVSFLRCPQHWQMVQSKRHHLSRSRQQSSCHVGRVPKLTWPATQTLGEASFQTGKIPVGTVR